jgi:hypothetical protein
MYSRIIRIKTYQGKVLIREGVSLKGNDKDLGRGESGVKVLSFEFRFNSDPSLLPLTPYPQNEP